MPTVIDHFPKVQIGEVVEGHIWTGVNWEREPLFSLPSAKASLLVAAAVLAATGGMAVLANYVSNHSAQQSASSASQAAVGGDPPPAWSDREVGTEDYTDRQQMQERAAAEYEDEVIATGMRYGTYPEDQREFVAVILAAREELEEAHDAQKERIMIRERDEKLVELIGEDYKVSDWVGTVLDKGVTAEGNGYVVVEVADEVWLMTWSTAFSDLNSHTLMPPDTTVAHELETVNIGQNIIFSGKFVKGVDTALDQGNWTEKKYGVMPKFLFRFSHVHPAVSVRTHGN